MKNIISGLLICLLLASCGSKKESPYPFKMHELGIKTNGEALSPLQADILKGLNKKKDPSNDQIIKAVVERQTKAYKQSDLYSGKDKDIIKELEKIVNKKLTNFSQMKTDYEAKLKAYHKGSDLEGDLIYNKIYSNINNAFVDNRMQCYSGTMMLELVRRMTSYKVYKKSNPVFIYEPGHVLPGYMEKTNDEWHLVGVESTMGGKALKEYGSVKNLKNIRVIDAHLSMAMEIFKYQIANEQPVFEKAITQTAERYGIPLDAYEKTLELPIMYVLGDTNIQTMSVEDKDSQNNLMNRSLPQFGPSQDVPDGDSVRASADSIDPTKSGQPNVGWSFQGEPSNAPVPVDGGIPCSGDCNVEPLLLSLNYILNTPFSKWDVNRINNINGVSKPETISTMELFGWWNFGEEKDPRPAIYDLGNSVWEGVFKKELEINEPAQNSVGEKTTIVNNIEVYHFTRLERNGDTFTSYRGCEFSNSKEILVSQFKIIDGEKKYLNSMMFVKLYTRVDQGKEILSYTDGHPGDFETEDELNDYRDLYNYCYKHDADYNGKISTKVSDQSLELRLPNKEEPVRNEKIKPTPPVESTPVGIEATNI